jgi:hypothetical protein
MPRAALFAVYTEIRPVASIVSSDALREVIAVVEVLLIVY